MRIVAGRYGGRRIVAPKGNRTRPTSDRVREALFSHLGAGILSTGFDDLHVLDLYAGSGSLGLEALSRGAETATFVEAGRDAQATILKNAASLGCAADCRLVRHRLPDGLKRLARGTRTPPPWDLVFCDPPWADLPYLDIIDGLRRQKLVAPDGVVVLEHAAANEIALPPEWTLISARAWGDTAVLICQPSLPA